VLQPPEKSTLAGWFETPKGAYVLRWLLAQFDSAVEDVFGFNALQVGLPEIDFLRANRMPLRMRAGADAGCEVRADPRQLPFATQSVDLVLLPHLLEFFHGGCVDFLLSIEAGPHGPFVKQVEQAAGLDEADGGGVRQHVHGE